MKLETELDSGVDAEFDGMELTLIDYSEPPGVVTLDREAWGRLLIFMSEHEWSSDSRRAEG